MRAFAIVPFLAIPGIALAADDERSSKAFDGITACRAIEASDARLACFDRAVDTFTASRARGDVLIVDRAKVVERKRARFGLLMAGDDVFGGGPEDAATEVKKVETTIRGVVAGKGNQWTLELANGSVWRTLEAPRMPPKAGQPVTLTTASLGGFRAAIAGRNSVLVKRVQ